MEYVGNSCSPFPLHEQPKSEFIFPGSAQYNQMCASSFSTYVLEESILLITLV